MLCSSVTKGLVRHRQNIAHGLIITITVPHATHPTPRTTHHRANAAAAVVDLVNDPTRWRYVLPSLAHTYMQRRQLHETTNAGACGRRRHASVSRAQARQVVLTREKGKNEELMHALDARRISWLELPLIEAAEGPDRCEKWHLASSCDAHHHHYAGHCFARF